MAHTIPQSNATIDNAIQVGADIYDANGIIKSDGSGNISVQTVDNTPTLNSSNPVSSGGVATSLSAISDDITDLGTDKADKVSGATNGNFAALNASGNLVDSGHKDSDYQDDVKLSVVNGMICVTFDDGN